MTGARAPLVPEGRHPPSDVWVKFPGVFPAVEIGRAIAERIAAMECQAAEWERHREGAEIVACKRAQADDLRTAYAAIQSAVAAALDGGARG